jgi:hypothetical protein
MTNQIAEHLEMLDDCEDRDTKMTEWELGFCESIRDRLENNVPLTVKQADTLENIWERVTDEG